MRDSEMLQTEMKRQDKKLRTLCGAQEQLKRLEMHFKHIAEENQEMREQMNGSTNSFNKERTEIRRRKVQKMSTGSKCN